MTPRETVVCATPRRLYANAHAYHINSVNTNVDGACQVVLCVCVGGGGGGGHTCVVGATFLSADDLRINLWHLDNTEVAFSAWEGGGGGFPVEGIRR